MPIYSVEFEVAASSLILAFLIYIIPPDTFRLHYASVVSNFSAVCSFHLERGIRNNLRISIKQRPEKAANDKKIVYIRCSKYPRTYFSRPCCEANTLDWWSFIQVWTGSKRCVCGWELGSGDPSLAEQLESDPRLEIEHMMGWVYKTHAVEPRTCPAIIEVQERFICGECFLTTLNRSEAAGTRCFVERNKLNLYSRGGLIPLSLSHPRQLTSIIDNQLTADQTQHPHSHYFKTLIALNKP
jgi:hypothetical protein